MSDWRRYRCSPRWPDYRSVWDLLGARFQRRAAPICAGVFPVKVEALPPKALPTA